VSLHHAVEFWPTATADDAKSNRSQGYSTESGRHPGTTLNDAIQQWPTPKAQSHNGERGNDLRHGRVLDEDAANWRTPHMRDHHPQGPRADHPQRQLYLSDQTSHWRTPDAPSAKGGGSRTHTTSAGNGHQLTIAEQAERWSTPNAHDAMGRRSESATLSDNHYYPHDLNTEAELWRTPQNCSPNSLRGSGQNPELRREQNHNVTLQDQACYWPTPRKSDTQADRPLTMSSTGTIVRQGNSDTFGVNLADIAANFSMWPTPDASTNRKSRKAMTASTANGRRSGGGNSSPPGLEQMAELALGEMPEELRGIPLPPATQKILRTTFHSSPPAHPIPDGLSFYERVRILLRLCRRLRCSLPSPYNKVRSMFRRKLNPNFVDWLMGQPVGWSSAGLVFSSEETASYLCNARRFLENSPRD
jgi:hypothetical protein